MKVRSLYFVVLNLSSLLFASQQEGPKAQSSTQSRLHIDFSVIPNASYFVRSEENPNIVKYYSFDGELLNEVSQPVNLKDEEKRIDPNAPRPQPVRSSIRYWPAISLGTVGTKGVPGFYIDFYDKHDNCFKSFRYHSDTKMIITLVRKDYEMVSYEERNYTIASDEEAQNLQYFPLDLSRCEMDMSIPTIPRASRRSFCNIL